jgi:GTP-binding protein EngB required for normal cell division
MRDLFELLDAVDLTLSRAGSVLTEPQLTPLASRAESLRTKRRYVGDVLVLAIAGGTGAGKSSVLNAIAGTEVSSVSVLRPHTDHPVAWIPAEADDTLRDALGRLGITRQVEQSMFPQLAIVDLPDMDSTASWHRQMVEDLLPRIDAVLWLFEPEKYRDRVVHEEFLSELNAYRHQFFFALNQIDRLRERDLKPVLDDLEAALVEDGFDDPLLFAIAAAPPDGAPVGLEELRAFLAHQLDVKRTAVAKTIIDARNLVREIAETGGVWNASPVDFERRWAGARDQAMKDLRATHGPAAREEAICRIEDLVAAMGTEVGSVFGTVIRHRFDREMIERVVDSAAAIADDEIRAVARLDELGTELGQVMWDRARLAATAVYAAIGADQLADSVGQLARSSWSGARTMSASGS